MVRMRACVKGSTPFESHLFYDAFELHHVPVMALLAIRLRSDVRMPVAMPHARPTASVALHRYGELPQ